MFSLAGNLRYTLRRLRKSPGFAFTAVLTLALGIAAACVVFSAVEAVLLRPLPFPEPSRLVEIRESVNKLGGELIPAPAPDVITFAEQSRSFSAIGGYLQQAYDLFAGSEPMEVRGARMNAAAFDALGVQPKIGRLFTRREDEASEPLVLISDSLWRTRFDSDPQIVGRKVMLDRKPYTVVGVMPADFEFPLIPGKTNQVQLWVPMSFTATERADTGDNFQYQIVARLKPGVSMAQAQTDVTSIARKIEAEYPPSMSIRMTASAISMREQVVKQARPLLRILMAAVLVLLLIAAANVAGLLLVRALRQRREYAVRLALGATASSLVRESLSASCTISVLAGVFGLAIAYAGLRTWTTLLPETLPRTQTIHMDAMIVSFALAISLLTGILCGLAPAFAAFRTGASDIKEGAYGSAGRLHGRLRSSLVIGEIAVALLLLTCAALLIHSFEQMRAVDPGFHADNVVTARFALPQVQYATQEQVDSFDQELLRRLEAAPGVRYAALTSALPIAPVQSQRFFVAEGYHPPSDTAYASESNAYVLGDYFRTLNIPLLRGRLLQDSDDSTSPLVVVVNHTLANRYWPGQDPIGKRIKWGIDPASPLPWITVVGEVADTKQGGLDTQAIPQAYQPVTQRGPSFGEAAKDIGVVGRSMRIAARSTLSREQTEALVRRTVASLDPQLAVSDMQTMEQAISNTEAPRRFNTVLFCAFALAALLLAVIGIYSIMAFSVAQRGKEIAVRMAVGARREDIVALTLASALRLALAGSAIGIIASLAATRLLRSLLFEVRPFDPLVFMIATASIVSLSLLASTLPARRAASVDPVAVLRSE